MRGCADGGQFDDVSHLGTISVREHAAMLRNQVRAISAKQQHDVDALERHRERPVIVKAALQNLDTFGSRKPGWGAHKCANPGAGCDNGIIARSRLGQLPR